MDEMMAGFQHSYLTSFKNYQLDNISFCDEDNFYHISNLDS
jgi:hypothetical protein